MGYNPILLNDFVCLFLKLFLLWPLGAFSVGSCVLLTYLHHYGLISEPGRFWFLPSAMKKLNPFYVWQMFSFLKTAISTPPPAFSRLNISYPFLQTFLMWQIYWLLSLLVAFFLETFHFVSYLNYLLPLSLHSTTLYYKV